jgi:hypothetical protein
MASNTECPKLAFGWHGYVCEGCDDYHIELFDERSKTFALMSIAPVDMVRLAGVLLRLALELEEDNSIESQTTH